MCEANALPLTPQQTVTKEGKMCFIAEENSVRKISINDLLYTKFSYNLHVHGLVASVLEWVGLFRHNEPWDNAKYWCRLGINIYGSFSSQEDEFPTLNALINPIILDTSVINNATASPWCLCEITPFEIIENFLKNQLMRIFMNLSNIELV